MKRLVLMRHAEAGWDDYDLPDHERPLTKDGLRDALKMGALIKEKELEI